MDGRPESSRSGGRHRSFDRYSSRSPSRSRSRSPTPSDTSMSPRSPPPSSPSTGNSANKTALHLENLSHNVRESHLRSIFGWYGVVQNVVIEGRGAWVVMSSVEEAAKAALYMGGGGQIDGKVLLMRRCEAPQDLADRRAGERRGRDERDRRDARERRGWHDTDETRKKDGYRVHPDRQRMVARGAGGDEWRNSDGRAKPMRRWGQPDKSTARGRDRSASPGSRRSSVSSRRRSPSY